jgi:ABC-type phosphate transport system substrate-binding protein
MLETVSGTAGGFGYSEVTNAEKRAKDDRDLVRITIAGQQAALDGVENGDCPYWQTELAYTYGEPPAGSLAFLTYLTEQGCRDVLRAYGNRLCSEVENPRVCEPS